MRLAILAMATLLLAMPAALAQNTLAGSYEVDGKKAALTQVAAYKGAPESGKPVTVLVFSAKPQKGATPANDALFGEFGDAIVVKLFDDGKVYSADLLHSAFNLPNNTMTAFSGVSIGNLKKADGQISGQLLSSGDARGQKWAVDVTFTAKAP